MYLHIHLDLICQTTLFSKKTEKKKTLPVQMPHPKKEKFEFPTPGHNKRWSNAWGMRGKGMLK